MHGVLQVADNTRRDAVMDGPGHWPVSTAVKHGGALPVLRPNDTN
jgi:hypothetical protein